MHKQTRSSTTLTNDGQTMRLAIVMHSVKVFRKGCSVLLLKQMSLATILCEGPVSFSLMLSLVDLFKVCPRHTLKTHLSYDIPEVGLSLTKSLPELCSILSDDRNSVDILRCSLGALVPTYFF